MDLAELENDYFPPSINRAREDKFFRPRRSPRRKLRASRVSASLVIDQLKSSFRRPGDLALPRMRGRRNWRLEFLMRHFRGTRYGRDEGRKDCKEAQRRPRRFAPEAPRIYSIGLYSNAGTLDDRRGDSTNGVLRSVLKRRLNIVRRAMIVCKYWTPSLPPIASASLQQGADQRTVTMTHRALNVPEQAPASDRWMKDNEGDSSRDDGATVEILVDDGSLEFDRNGSFVGKDSHVTRKDAQIQTRTSWPRRRAVCWGKPGTSDDDESSSRPCDEMFTEVRVDARRSKLPVRVQLANKRAEYASQRRAPNRQETTATGETRCGDEHSRGNPDKGEKGSSLRSDDVKKFAKRKLDGNEAPPIVPRGKDDSVDAEGTTVAESERQGKSVRRCDESCSLVPRANTSVAPSTTGRCKNSDIPPRERFTPTTRRDETKAADPAGKTAGSERRAKCHVVKQICFDPDLTKDQDETREEFSIENESFREIYLRDDFRVSNGDEYAKMPIKKLGDLGGFGSTKVADEKMGERAILVDIKRRIDRDFDDPSADKYDNDVEDFLTMSERSFEHQLYVTPRTRRARDRTIEKSRSTPLLGYGPTGDTVHDSTSVGTVSDSNRNSLSKYFSCTQLSSLISLTENEDELALENRDTIAHDLSCTNLHSDSNYHDLDLTSSIDYLYPDDSSLNGHSYRLNRAKFHSSAYSTRHDPSYDLSSDRLFIEQGSIKDDDGDPDGKFYDGEYLARGIDDTGGTLRGLRGLERRRTADSTFDSTSKSSRYIGSIDSGVFVNSSLLDLYPRESSAEAAKPGAKRKTRRARRLNESRLASSSDSDSTDDTLGRKVDDIVRDLTKNLILCERRARRRLEEMQRNFRAKRGTSYSRHTRSRTSRFTKDPPRYDAYYDLFDSARRSSEDERILSISTPSLLSLTDSEIDERESIAKS